jgi:predicted esterase
MKNLSTLILILGLGLVGYAGWLYVGETTAAPTATPTADVAIPAPGLATAAPPRSIDPVDRPALATQPPAPYPPALFIARERRDIRPAAINETGFEPTTRDVTTFEEGVRRVGLYDGGQGDTPRPVIVLFHGAARDELSMIDMWDSTADAHGLLLLSVKSLGERWDPSIDDRPLIAAALAHAENTIPIDHDRIFLFGHSNGSRHAQFLANRVDGPWRAVATHAGTLATDLMQPRVAGGPPIRHYLGTSDHLFPTDEARVAAETLADMGHRSELMVLPTHTHWFYSIGPRIATDAWLWFNFTTETD